MRIILFCLLGFLFVACARESRSKNGKVIGSWKLASIYDGRTAGGCFCWQGPIPTGVQILQFRSNGSFAITLPPISSQSGCTGRYLVENDTTITLISSCYSTSDSAVQHRMEYRGDTLVIDYSHSVGLFRYKYSRQ